MKSDRKPEKQAIKASEQPVILEKPIFWSRAFIWLIVSMTVAAVGWASFAEIEEAVPAVGKLEPVDAVKDVQAPSGGVIRSIEVKEGQRVKEGEILVTLDPTAPQADQESLSKARASLAEENRFFTAQLNGFVLQTPQEDNSAADFRLTQRNLLIASQAELQSRVGAAQLQVQQLQTQYIQAQQQLASAKSILSVNQDIIKQSLALYESNQKILEGFKPAVESGALARTQYNQQEQRVLSAQADVLTRQSQIESTKSEVNRLTKETERLADAIAESSQKLNNTVSLTQKDILTRIADNQKKISDIDGQLSKAKLNLKYQEIRSPISGTVFNIKAAPSGVITGVTNTQPLMTIVPDGNLVAKVYITNRDIGFIKEGMPADVKIDSFPNLEFGSIKGKLITIGSDALPPTQERQYYSFPAKIEMEKQTLDVGGKKLALQSGMAVSTSVLVRKRTVMTIFLSQFISKTDSLKYVR